MAGKKDDDKSNRQRSSGEFNDLVERLEKQRLEVVGDFKEQLGKSLEIAAEKADTEKERREARVAAKVMKAEAHEFKKAVRQMESEDTEGEA